MVQSLLSAPLLIHREQLFRCRRAFASRHYLLHDTPLATVFCASVDQSARLSTNSHVSSFTSDRRISVAMRFIVLLVVALALLCVAAAQPSAAPVTLSFSYEHEVYQPNAAQQDEVTPHQQSMEPAALNETSSHSHLASPIVTTHPLPASHTQLLSMNDTEHRAANSTSDSVAGGMGRNSTKDSMATMGKDDKPKVSADRSSNATDSERQKDSERPSERREGEKEESFPDEPSNPHNITHGNRTHTNRSQYHTRPHSLIGTRRGASGG